MNDIPFPDTLPEVDLDDGRTVISYEGSFYRVLVAGEVQAFPARGIATPDNAIADLVSTPPTRVVYVPPVILTPLTLIARLTPSEQLAIFTSTHPAVCVWRGMAGAALEIRSDDPRTAEGLAALVSLGILAAYRPAQLLAP